MNNLAEIERTAVDTCAIEQMGMDIWFIAQTKNNSASWLAASHQLDGAGDYAYLMMHYGAASDFRFLSMIAFKHFINAAKASADES